MKKNLINKTSVMHQVLPADEARGINSRRRNARGIEGAHVLEHPLTGEDVLVVGVDELSTRVRLYTCPLSEYDNVNWDWTSSEERNERHVTEIITIHDRVKVIFG